MILSIDIKEIHGLLLFVICIIVWNSIIILQIKKIIGSSLIDYLNLQYKNINYEFKFY